MNPYPANWNDKARHALNTHLWLILSLVANFFLVIFLYIATDPLGVPQVPVARPDSGPLLKTNVVVRHENFTWEQVESTNYQVFIKNLRALGCPEQTIRDMVVSEVSRLYQRRRLEEVVYPNYQWWLAEPEASVVKEANAKLNALETDRKNVLTSLLGAGWEGESDEQIAAAASITLTGPILGDMPAELKDSVYAIVAHSEQRLQQYRAAQRQAGKPIDAMDIVRLRAEMLGQLVPVLSPKQYEEFALRYSPSADQLRFQLKSLTLTPDQFRDLYTAINSIDGQPVFYYTGNDPVLRGQEQQLRAQSEAIIKNVLGDQLYSAYQLNQDPLYRSSKELAQQLGVSSQTVTSLYEINRVTQSELDRIRKDPNLSNDEKVEAMSQTQVEQQQTLQQILGPAAFQRYLQSNISLKP